MKKTKTPITDEIAKEIGKLAARWKDGKIDAKTFSDVCESYFNTLRALERRVQNAEEALEEYEDQWIEEHI